MSELELNNGPHELLHVVMAPSTRPIAAAVLELIAHGDNTKWYQSILVEQSRTEVEIDRLAMLARGRGTPVVSIKPEHSASRIRLLLSEYHLIRSLHIDLVHVHTMTLTARPMLTRWLPFVAPCLSVVETTYEANGDTLTGGLLRISGPRFAGATILPFTAATHVDQVARAYAAATSLRRSGN